MTLYPLSLVTKMESSFGIRVVTLRGRVSFWDHCVRGSVRRSEDIMCLFFSFFLIYIVLVHEVL